MIKRQTQMNAEENEILDLIVGQMGKLNDLADPETVKLMGLVNDYANAYYDSGYREGSVG